MSQKFTTGLSVSTNSSLMIKRELSGILYGNYSLLLQFEKLKENNSSETILVPKKGGNPNFLEGKKFIQDYLDKQVKESLLNSANPTKAKLRGNNSNPKSMVLNISTNEGSKRNFSKTTLTNTTGETVNNMNTAGDSETNKIQKISMSKISSSHTGSPEISLCKSSLNTKCDGKSSALSDSRSIGLQKWRNPIVGYKQVTKDTSQETENAVNFVQTQLISDKSSGCKVPTPLVVDMKSSKVNAKENSNNEDDDECVVIVKEVEKQKDTPVSGTKRKYDKLLHRNANEQSENTTDDSIIIIDDGPEDECKKRECICDDSVIIVEDTDSKQTKKRRNRSSSVLGIQRRKGKNRKEYESLSSENKGKQLQSYESVLKKDFIPLNSCASVVTYVNEYQFSRGFQRSKNDAVQSDMLSVYIDKGKDFYSSTRFQQSTSQSIAPQQHQYQHQPQPQPQPPAIVGDNICSVKKVAGKQTGLRPIVIDGSNVAMGHTNGREFSCEGLKICIDYFLERKHKVIAFVPRFRQGRCTNADLLSMLEKRGLVTYTPSRRVNGKLQVSYDDRFIVQYAAECGGVIVSTDNFRDLLEENPNWRETIEQRLLMFTWAGDVLMFPHDPLGRGGPTLEALLRFPD